MHNLDMDAEQCKRKKCCRLSLNKVEQTQRGLYSFFPFISITHINFYD